MTKKLKAHLDRLAGDEEIEWIIPHPFLPPRYKKVCENRNMILLIDRDFTAHIRWEGARRGKWCSPTAGEIRTLIRQVKTKMTTYRRQLDVFSDFVTESVDIPFADPVDNDPSSRREPKKAEPLEDEEDDGVDRPLDLLRKRVIDEGGESPMPMAMEFFG